jgi:hypothetical protein
MACLVNKSGAEITRVLISFESFTKRQYRLSICVFKHNNDTLVIAIHRYTVYEIWTNAKGIEKELSPTNTHESNRGAKRAGQEVITRSIKMRIRANLPAYLWPKTTLAAIHLYNKSPSDAHIKEEEEIRSPNERLDSWFRNYFRWYNPELINKITTDLRPN